MYSQITLFTRNIMSASRNNENATVTGKKEKKKRKRTTKMEHNLHNKTDIVATVVVAKSTP